MASLEALEGGEAKMMCHTPGVELHPARVTFPYAFPQAGPYLLVVQMKREGQVYTAFFDVTVDAS